MVLSVECLRLLCINYEHAQYHQNVMWYYQSYRHICLWTFLFISYVEYCRLNGRNVDRRTVGQINGWTGADKDNPFAKGKLISLLWRHNGRDGVSNHQPHDCLLNRSLRCRSKKTSKLRVTGLCARNSPVTGEFPAQRASNAENVSIWWRHHVNCYHWVTPAAVHLT